MPDKDICNIPITVEVPKADVWLRADYRDIVHRLGEVHLIRACEHQHDDDFVPMYDYQMIEQYQIEAERLRALLHTERAAYHTLRERAERDRDNEMLARHALQAERDALARRLHEIAEEWAGAECGEPVHAQEAYAIALAKRMYTIAVEARKP